MGIGKYAKNFTAGILAVACMASLAACGPGSSSSGEDAETEPITTDLGDETYELTLWDGAGLKDLDEALIAAFEEEYPNITITGTYDPDNMTRTNGPKIISSSDAPDIAAITDISSAASGGHVTSLEGYADAYGWELPDFQTVLYRAEEDGSLGGGDLYAVPVGQSFTGVFWNKSLGEQIGMTEAPKTLDEFRDALEKAKDAGILPIMVNGKDGGASFIFQSLFMSQYGKDALEEWVLQRDDATFDTPESVAVAAEMQEWAENGYLPDGVNAIDSTTALGRFVEGEGLFYFSGNWSTSQISEQLGDDAGFFAFPGQSEDDPVVAALNAGTSLGIPTNAENKNAAAAFLNFLTSDEAREITVNSSSYAPSGTGEMPEVDDALQAEVLAAYSEISDSGESTNFISNATSGMQQSGLEPNFQQLLDGSMEPEAFATAVQDEYNAELGRD